MWVCTWLWFFVLSASISAIMLTITLLNSQSVNFEKWLTISVIPLVATLTSGIMVTLEMTIGSGLS